jgi:hypothetical protein
MPRILKNLRIDEVSAVMKSAGVGTKVVIMKRDTSGDDSAWLREQAAIAERQNEEHVRKHAPTWRSFDEVLAERTAKSVEGDEAEGLIADPHPVDDVIADAADRRRDDGIVFDIGDTRMKFPNERALAVWLAVQERIRKSNQEDTAMTQTTEKLEAERTAKLDEVVKSYGIMPLAKQMIAEGSSYGINEGEFTALAVAHAQRAYPDISPAAAFEKLFSDGSEDGIILREAHGIVKAATFTPIVVDGNADNPDDASEATEALSRLVEEQRARAPWMSAEQLYEEVMRKNPELTVKAFRRPAATTTYPFPR